MKLSDLRLIESESTNTEPLNEWLLQLLPWLIGPEMAVTDVIQDTGYDDVLPPEYYDNPDFSTPWMYGYEPGGYRYDHDSGWWYVDVDGDGRLTTPPDRVYDNPYMSEPDDSVDPTLQPDLPDEFMDDDPVNPDAWEPTPINPYDNPFRQQTTPPSGAVG